MSQQKIASPWPLIPIFFLAAIAWMVLAGVMETRTHVQEDGLRGRVHDLWGATHRQAAPTVTHIWTTRETVRRPVVDADGAPVLDGRGQPVLEDDEVVKTHRARVPLTRTRVAVDLALDQRRKGLLWFPLYDVGFDGAWRVDVPEGEGFLEFSFPFPDQHAVYDDFAFRIGAGDVTQSVEPRDGQVRHRIELPSDAVLDFSVGYRSRGMSTWTYQPLEDVGRLADFELDMTTDFGAIDFPAYTLSPSSRAALDDGWALQWHFSQVVTSHGIGMVMPERTQPGPLVAHMSLSAPISLGLFMLWIYVLGVVKGVRVHWVNHLFLAASFFSFHLLFAYTADHLPLEGAFALSSVVSIFLVVSYLRLVVSARFALVEAGLAQLLYLVGFSLAHFWKGYTGLTITVLGIITLFGLMQLTAGVAWEEVFAKKAPEDPEQLPA